MAQPLWQLLAQMIKDGQTDAWNNIKGDVDNIAKDAGEAASGGLLGKVARLGSIFSLLGGAAQGLLGDVPIIGGLLSDGVGLFEGAVDPMAPIEDAAGPFALSLGWGYALGYLVSYFGEPIFQPIKHWIAAQVQTELIDPQTAADLVARGFMDHKDASFEAAGGNLAGWRFDNLISAAQIRPGLADMLTMWRRKMITDGDFVTALEHDGYDQFWQAAIPQLFSQLLSPADIALAVLRGEKTQTEGEAYAMQLGYGADDFNTLILNTGEPPSPQDLLFGYRRGYIGKDELEHGLRQSRLRDEWIPFMETMRYVPMATADAVRATVENYLTPDEGKAIAQQNGLLPEHWDYLYESWGRPLAHEQMADLYFRGKASLQQFDQAMRESDIKDKYIPQALEIATRLLPIYQITDALKAGIIPMQDAATQLLQQGYDEIAVSTILKYALHTTATAGHELTRAEIVSLYADGGLTRAQAVTHLEAIGYTSEIADQTLLVQDLKAHAAELRSEIKVIRDNYVSGAIDQVTADAELKQLGLTGNQVTINLATWNREKRRASKGLSEAQVIKAAKAGTYTFGQALQLLAGIGYSKGDAAVLLTSNGVTAQVGPQPPQAPVSGSDVGA
jgi:hypothetical protein